MRLLLAVVLLLVLLAAFLSASMVQKIDDGEVPVHALAPSPMDGDPLAYRYVLPTTTTSTTTTTAPKRKSSPKLTKSGTVYPTDEWLDRLARCESGMDPTTNTGNGYFGAFQFDVPTWWSVGGEGYPHEHPYEVQRELARTLILQAGWGRFPSCSRTIGAR